MLVFWNEIQTYINKYHIVYTCTVFKKFITIKLEIATDRDDLHVPISPTQFFSTWAKWVTGPKIQKIQKLIILANSA